MLCPWHRPFPRRTKKEGIKSGPAGRTPGRPRLRLSSRSPQDEPPMPLVVEPGGARSAGLTVTDRPDAVLHLVDGGPHGPVHPDQVHRQWAGTARRAEAPFVPAELEPPARHEDDVGAEQSALD